MACFLVRLWQRAAVVRKDVPVSTVVVVLLLCEDTVASQNPALTGYSNMPSFPQLQGAEGHSGCLVSIAGVQPSK